MSEREWQPIETAPKDGTSVLGTDGRECAVVHFFRGHCWMLTVTGIGTEDSEWWPTHWQPLPPPPQTGANTK